MSWRFSPALERLRQEVNFAHPNRDTTSDGTIGDPAHASRFSYHNPDKDGIVRAWDVDASGGVARSLVQYLISTRQPRIYRIIFDRQIIASYNRPHRKAWTWGPYSGSNSHTKHAHIVVTNSGKMDKRTWGYTSSLDAAQEDDVDEVVKGIQKALNAAGYNSGPVDGLWGPRTAGAFAQMCEDASSPVSTYKPHGHTFTVTAVDK